MHNRRLQWDCNDRAIEKPISKKEKERVTDRKQRRQPAAAEGRMPEQTTVADIKVTKGNTDKFIVVRHVCTGEGKT